MTTSKTKRRPGRPKGSKNKTKKTDNIVRNDMGRFVKGHSGNPAGIPAELREHIYAVKRASAKMLSEKAIAKLEVALDDKDITIKELVMIVKVLADISMPKNFEIESPNNTNNIPQIVISDKMMQEAIARDKQYNEDGEED